MKTITFIRKIIQLTGAKGYRIVALALLIPIVFSLLYSYISYHSFFVDSEYCTGRNFRTCTYVNEFYPDYKYYRSAAISDIRGYLVPAVVGVMLEVGWGVAYLKYRKRADT